MLVGRIARAHGNRGQVIVNPETDFLEERFRVGNEVWLERDDRVDTKTIVAARFHRGRPIIGLEGVDTMDLAEGLAGVELRVPESALEPLPAGMFYRHDLVGCGVSTVAGDDLGVVVGVEGPLSGGRLVVRDDACERLVPLVAEICVTIDVGARRIMIDPPDGLLELNP